jgi:hypothetical protein
MYLLNINKLKNKILTGNFGERDRFYLFADVPVVKRGDTRIFNDNSASRGRPS